MRNLFRVSKFSIIVWVLLFIASPLPYNGYCIDWGNKSCPEWIFFGGYYYLHSFFGYIIYAIESNAIPAKTLLGVAFSLLPTLLTILIISYLITHTLFALIRKLKS